MGKFRLNRRTVLRGAGSIAIALPWLEIMSDEKVAHAQQAGEAKRFLSVYTPGGTVAGKFWPAGTETEPIDGSILAPLAPVRSKLLTLKGLDYKCKAGEQHQAGIIAFLTGSKQDGSPMNYSSNASIDQVIATRVQSDPLTTKKRDSLRMAVRWATGNSKGLLHPINCMNYADNPLKSPLSPQLDPVKIFDELFGALDPAAGAGAADARTARRRSVLDLVGKRYQALSVRLGTSDRAKLDEHLTKIRAIEQGLDKNILGTAICRQPTKVDTTGYNPTTGLNSDSVGSILDVSTDTLIPDVGMLMMDMMVMAFACDITAVGSFQWTDTEAKHTFPWIGLMQHHHFYQHDGTFRPAECEQIGIWYSKMHAHLLQAMDAVQMAPDRTLLDESVVLFGSELAHPPDHTANDIPFLLAGGGGGLKGGRHLNYGGRSHNDMLVAILNLFGDTRTSYGDAEFNNGALANLKG